MEGYFTDTYAQLQQIFYNPNYQIQNRVKDLDIEDFIDIEKGPETIGQWLITEQMQTQRETLEKIRAIWQVLRGRIYFDAEMVMNQLTMQTLSMAMTYNLIQTISTCVRGISQVRKT